MVLPSPAQRRRARNLVSSGVLLFALLATAGCAPQKADGPKPVPPEPSYVSNYEAPPATEIAPLRGTTVKSGSLAHASIAAKIDNHWDARPQVGLEATDILFEELVEGGITRYVAVWQSTIPDLFGPVRSIRPMDPNIVSPLGGIICYSGGQQRFVNLMRSTPVYNAIHGQSDTASTFFRTKDKTAPHNVMVKAKEVLAQHSDLAAPKGQFAYSLDAASSTAHKDGSPTAVLNYRFSQLVHGSWTYDPAAQLFLRAQDDAPDLDSHGVQLSATNVVVLRVTVTDDQNVPRTEMLTGGEAWVSTGGATVHAAWHKASPTAPIELTDDNGVAVRLAAGNTWVELIPAAGSVEFVAP